MWRHFRFHQPLPVSVLNRYNKERVGQMLLVHHPLWQSKSFAYYIAVLILIVFQKTGDSLEKLAPINLGLVLILFQFESF